MKISRPHWSMPLRPKRSASPLPMRTNPAMTTVKLSNVHCSSAADAPSSVLMLGPAMPTMDTSIPMVNTHSATAGRAHHRRS
jgi:hypothetical protein